MNCERYEELIHLYVDHRLDKKEEVELFSHMETCTHCRETYEEISALKDLIGGMQMKELPEGFEEDLHLKLVEASVEKEKSLLEKIKEKITMGTKMKMTVSFGAVAIAAVLVIANSNLIPNMSQMKSENYEMAYEATEEADFVMAEPAEAPMVMSMAKNRGAEEVTNFALEETSEAMDAGVSTEYGISSVELESTATVATQTAKQSIGQEFTGRLIIKTANISMNVENYDDSSAELSRMVEEMGGYISDTSSYYYIYDQYDDTKNRKTGYMTLRVPHQFFDQFVNQMNTFGDITNYSSNANDITKQYRDTSAEVENLKVREAKLREIMGKAEEIKDIIEVERELSRVRSEINGYQSVLTDWEDLITLSTITVDMTEVEELKDRVQPVDKDMFTKAKEGFIYTINRIVDVVESLVIWLIAASPVLLPVIIVAGVVLRKLMKRWKK